MGGVTGRSVVVGVLSTTATRVQLGLWYYSCRDTPWLASGGHSWRDRPRALARPARS
jgi:hypothetical protein